MLWFVVITALLLVLDLVVVVLLAVGGVLAHVLLRRPWEVEASSGDRRLTWLVGGWRPGHYEVDEVAASLRAGRVPEGNTAR